MATIKLGSLTLGKVAIGNSTIGDTRKLNRSNAFKAKAVDNHKIDKEIINAIRAYELIRDSIQGVNEGNEEAPVVQPDGGSNWLLANLVWDDNGVWDDTQNWTE